MIYRWIGLVLLAGPVSAQQPVADHSLYSVNRCDFFDSITVNEDDVPPFFTIDCALPPDAVSDFPGSQAMASVFASPALGNAGYAELGRTQSAAVASTQTTLNVFYRVDALQAPPFDPIQIPMLWVTQGRATLMGDVVFQAWSQFRNEGGSGVATYLLADNLDFQRIRPYQTGVGYDNPLTLFSECFANDNASEASSCDFSISAFPVFDQARFDAIYGASSFPLDAFYELRFSPGFEVVPDMDGDAVLDGRDNCTFRANPDQRDTDGDGLGNRCDADFNNDCVVNVIDLGVMRAGFLTSDPLLDLDGDGQVNAADLAIMRANFLQAPGPSVATLDCR